MNKNKTLNTTMPDFSCEHHAYSICASKGRFTQLRTGEEKHESFLGFLDGYRNLDYYAKDVKSIIEKILSQNVQLSDITKQCITELKNGNEIYDYMHIDRIDHLEHVSENLSTFYDPRYLLSKRMFEHAINSTANISERDMEGAMREELVKNLEKCKTTEDFEEAYYFQVFSDYSPILHTMLSHKRTTQSARHSGAIQHESDAETHKHAAKAAGERYETGKDTRL